MHRKLFFTILLSICFISSIKAAKIIPPPVALSESAEISILTSAPWAEQAYAVYGHSAMRIYDPEMGINAVFNYGIFDFNSPNFIYRFMAGETDYIVAAVDYNYYLPEYQMRGVNVYEQVVNLTPDEKQNIWEFLLNNIKPENRVYRYNIFYNNCTTKLADILEQNINGKIVYPDNNKVETFRSLVHEHVNKQLWMQFGIDLVIGASADKPITVREKMFLPIYEKNTFDKSHIQLADGTTKPLIIKESVIPPFERSDETENIFFTPLVAGILLLILSILISVYGLRKERVACKIFDTLLFFIAGIGGCIVFFMMYFSVHPCTNPNWNLVWLNPLQLIVSFLFFVKACRKYVYYYHFINFATLLLFLLAWCLIPQQLEIAFIPFIMAIALRSGMNAWQYKKMKQKSRQLV